MAQKDYDELMKLTDSRYKLTMIVSRRAAQLKYGATDTLTKKPIPREKNAVSAAMEELVEGDSIKWGDDLPDQVTILQTAQNENRERHDKQENAFSITQEGDDLPPRGPYRSGF